ncbi:cell wall hydrolase [Sphingomonas sp. Y38-1Y]|uniref:cell wall hydrolase n=1 Tax=Sphingomonas sp. Y38-1Y TaxID=3078265 RepID=UPI0028E9D454|nr:cell wall hydrolase [Sphingomonas sp. Y38-1Y]
MNAPYPTQVPTPPSPIVPAEWTREEPAEASAATTTAAAQTDFDTLRDAVAAQAMPEAMDRELRCLATGIYYEAKGEPLHGQLAVAEVILNRTRSGRFPTDVCKVLTQRGQFSFVRGGRLPGVEPSRTAWRTAVAVAQVAKRELWESKAGNALFFHARHVSPSWNRAKVAMLGNHIFYR